MGDGMRNMVGAAYLCGAWLGGSLLFATGCWAADVQAVQGDLSINQGDGFAPIKGRIEANVGDSLMVGPNGLATVSYADGCQVSVQPGTVITIAPISPCAAGSYAQDFTNPFGSNLVAPIIVGVAVGTALGIAAYESSRNNNTPTSPSSP